RHLAGRLDGGDQGPHAHRAVPAHDPRHRGRSGDPDAALMGDFAFDEDSRVLSAGSSGEFTAELTSRWNGTAGAVNGGYMLAICTRALALGMPFPDPVVVSGFFLRPGTAGPAAVGTSVIRSGRSTAFGEAALTQDGKDVVRATAAFARLGGTGQDSTGQHGTGQDGTGQDGLVFLDGTPPALPPPAECVGVPVGVFGLASIAERIEFRSAELPGWFLGRPSGRP